MKRLGVVLSVIWFIGFFIYAKASEQPWYETPHAR
jgi:hypothetical protein